MHLNLSPISIHSGPHPQVLPPTDDEIWGFFDDRSSLHPDVTHPVSTPPGVPQQSSLYFREEIQLQQLLDNYLDPVVGNKSIISPAGLASKADKLDFSQLFATFLHRLQLGTTTTTSLGITEHHNHLALLRTKYYAYEISLYWPAIRRIMENGFADCELLPYGPLFFESAINFLTTATATALICPPKSWSLYAR